MTQEQTDFAKLNSVLKDFKELEPSRDLTEILRDAYKAYKPRVTCGGFAK